MPYGLIRNAFSSSGTRAEMWLAIMSAMPYQCTSRQQAARSTRVCHSAWLHCPRIEGMSSIPGRPMAALLFIFQATGVERGGRRRPVCLVSPGNQPRPPAMPWAAGRTPDAAPGVARQTAARPAPRRRHADAVPTWPPAHHEAARSAMVKTPPHCPDGIRHARARTHHPRPRWVPPRPAYRRPCSAAARKAEHRPFAHARRGPALGDGLALGVEAHGVGAVGVQVAEQAALEAAERVVGHGHGQGHVHAHHADLYVVAEV